MRTKPMGAHGEAGYALHQQESARDFSSKFAGRFHVGDQVVLVNAGRRNYFANYLGQQAVVIRASVLGQTYVRFADGWESRVDTRYLKWAHVEAEK